MVAKSYDGETQTGICPECDETAEIAGEGFQKAKREPYEGYCQSCDKIVTFVTWSMKND